MTRRDARVVCDHLNVLGALLQALLGTPLAADCSLAGAGRAHTAVWLHVIPVLAVARAIGAQTMPSALQRLAVKLVLRRLRAQLLAAVNIAKTWVAHALVVDDHAIIGAVDGLACSTLETLLTTALAVTPCAAILAVMLAAVVTRKSIAAGAAIDTTHTISGAVEGALAAVGASPLANALAHATLEIAEAATVGGAIIRTRGSLATRPCPARVALAHAIAALAMAGAVERALRNRAVETGPARLAAALPIDTAGPVQAPAGTIVF